VEGRNGSVSLLPGTVPELKADVKVVDDSVLEREIVSDGGDGLFSVLFTLESIDEGGLADCALSDETDLDQFVDIVGFSTFGEHLHK
jgi:hypothetical protein